MMVEANAFTDIENKEINNMNQKQFINSVCADLAEQGGAHISKAQVARNVKSMLAVLHKQMVAGESVHFTNFGTFSTRINKARAGRNPRTGEEIHIPATRVVKFSAGAGLKRDVAAK